MKKHLMIILILFLFSCDIPGKITIKNISNNPVGYKFEIVEGDIPKEYNLAIDNQKKSNEITILFGFGQHWTDERIKEYSESINFVEIATYKDTIKIDSKDELFKFFKDQRRGLFKEEIKIIIE